MTNKTQGCTRRTFLLAAMASTGAHALRPRNAFGLTKTLRESAESRGITFGGATGAGPLHDRSFARLFARQCGIAVPELALKWAAIRPTPDSFDFSAGDLLYDFCKSHGILFRGHTLVWEQALPKWFGQTVTKENANNTMTDHISTVARHYAGKMHSWDVVNEAFQIEDGRPDGLKITPWLRLIGPEYIETAFHVAHEADPQATLVYNETWLEPEDSVTDRKRKAVLTLLTRMKKANIPVHALGIQSHLYADTNTCNASFQRFLQQVSDLGLGIMITEMDVRIKKGPADIATRDRLIASQYYKHLSFMLQFPAVKTVITWGLSNRYTWLATHDRTDGLPVRPLPYDAELKPTPAWDAIRKAFDEAPRR